MEIITGKINSALKVVVYGPEGIGKSTFASKFPNPLFIDTEGSTKNLNVARLEKPTSFRMILQEINYVRDHPNVCKTLVLDTADWAEQICMRDFCAAKKVSGIEDIGYGKGYVYLAEDFGRMLNALEEVVEKGIHVVITAHAQMRKFEQPDELGAYDRWELKLQKKTAPLLKEWADMVLFANYKTYVINVDNQGAVKGKNKVQGGQRVMYTSHHPCWDAKNRHDLNEELTFDYRQIEHIFNYQNNMIQQPKIENQEVNKELDLTKQSLEIVENVPVQNDTYEGIPKALADLMKMNNVTKEEIQRAVGYKGYYPEYTPISNYDESFIQGCLISAWDSVYKMVIELRGLPF